MDNYRVEIIDNEIAKHYSYIFYKWRKRKWWCTENSWCIHAAHYLGYNYKMPDWAKQKPTKQIFDEELESALNQYQNIEEVKYINIVSHNQLLLNVCINKQ